MSFPFADAGIVMVFMAMSFFVIPISVCLRSASSAALRYMPHSLSSFAAVPYGPSW